MRLNRRLAGDTYVDVVALRRDERGNMTLDGRGQLAECLVKMRRLPVHRFLSTLIVEAGVAPSDLTELCTRLTEFYRSSSPEPLTAEQYRRLLEREIRMNAVTAEGVENDVAASVQAAQLAFLRASASMFDERVVDGRIVEGHGDLRPEHI